ncbi:MAG: c-type cytochrome domain-containing protein, partial [Planctomycetaceae bacterium]
APLLRTIAISRKLLARAKGESTDPANLVSFTDDVAPVLREKCARCHGDNNPRNGFRVGSHEALLRGGRSGRAIVPGNAAASPLVARLNTSGDAMMPKGGPPLSAEERQTIAVWITQGAKDDTPPQKPVVIPKPAGDETVSFTKDIAPFMVNLCLRCHSGNDPRGGLSLETFENLMRGGDSGEVIIPGNREDSRLFRLVGGLENPRMPQGQARITRQNYEDLKQWFAEGNTYDGGDPKTPLRELVPTEEELRAERFARMTPEEFVAHRKQRSEEQWKRAVPKEPRNLVESEEFLVYGNVPEERLKEIDAWATEHATALRELAGEASGRREPADSSRSISGLTPAARMWKGKLAIFVMDGRFEYEEFNIVINDRRVPPEVIGHSVVTPSFEDAYVVLQDIGDEVDSESPGMKVNLIEHLTGAFLQRRLPIRASEELRRETAG